MKSNPKPGPQQQTPSSFKLRIPHLLCVNLRFLCPQPSQNQAHLSHSKQERPHPPQLTLFVTDTWSKLGFDKVGCLTLSPTPPDLPLYQPGLQCSPRTASLLPNSSHRRHLPLCGNAESSPTTRCALPKPSLLYYRHHKAPAGTSQAAAVNKTTFTREMSRVHFGFKLCCACSLPH